MADNNTVAKVPKVEEIALAKIKEFQDNGLVIYPGFNPTNSLKKARFILNDMKDKTGKPVLLSCTVESIVQCLVDSMTKGLDYSENQVYFVPRGNVMTNLESVYGRIVRAKRASKNYRPVVQFVHEGDEFEFGPNLETGDTKIFKHTTTLENQDKPIIAAYTYVTDNDNNTSVFIMSRKEWLTSWQKSSNGCAVAKDFERDMIMRTIIKKATKTLVNSNTTTFGYVPDDDDTPLAGTNAPEPVDEQSQAEEFVEDTPPVEEDKTPQHDEEKSEDAPVKVNNNAPLDDDF